jgi:NCS1 family nucleobase:cation symporter-1
MWLRRHGHRALGSAINLMFGFHSPAVGIIIFGALTALVAVVGYRLIHVVGRISTVVGILGFGYLAWQLCRQFDVVSAFGQKPFTWASFLTAMALSAGWQMTFAPYVADYSRYLPTRTSTAATFWTTFSGSVISSQLAMTFGVLVAALGANFIKNQVGFMGQLAGPLAVIYLVIVTGKLTVNCLNAYGGFMTVLTTVSAFNRKTQFTATSRLLYILGFVLVTVLVALLASSTSWPRSRISCCCCSPCSFPGAPSIWWTTTWSPRKKWTSRRSMTARAAMAPTTGRPCPAM